MSLREDMRIDAACVAPFIEQFLRRKHAELKRDGAVVGLSGGVDSAVVASLCARALGRDRVLALLMFEPDSGREAESDARMLAEDLGIRMRSTNLLRPLKTFHSPWRPALSLVPWRLKAGAVRRGYAYYGNRFGKTPFAAGLDGLRDEAHGAILKRGNAYYRVKHRLRMVQLYYEADMENCLVAGAANRSEWEIGFFVKFGCDHGADVMPLLGLYKTQVLELAGYLGVPERIIRKPPSPDVFPGLTDAAAIGMGYEHLDLMLLGLARGMEPQALAAELNVDPALVARVSHMKEASAHMRQVYVPAGDAA